MAMVWSLRLFQCAAGLLIVLGFDQSQHFGKFQVKELADGANIPDGEIVHIFQVTIESGTFSTDLLGYGVLMIVFEDILEINDRSFLDEWFYSRVFCFFLLAFFVRVSGVFRFYQYSHLE